MGRSATKKPRIYGRGRDNLVTALDQAIRVHYGDKDAALAVALKVSEGRVSQYFNGPGTLDRRAIGRILAAFPRGLERDAVFAAWERDFVPGGAPGASLEPLTAREALARADGLESERRLHQARTVLSGALSAAPTAERGPLYAKAVLLDLQLGDPGSASLLLQKGWSNRGAAEPFDELTLLWVRGLVLRASGADAPRLLAAFCRASNFARARSKGLSGKAAREFRSREMEIRRDEAVALITGSPGAPPTKGDLERAWALARESAEEAPHDPAKSVGLEIVARAELGLGRLQNCEDTLAEAVALSGGLSDMAQKAGLIEAEILIADRDVKKARDLLIELSRRAERDESAHYRRAAQRRLAELVQGITPTFTSRAIRDLP